MILTLITRLAPGLIQWLARTALHAVRESTNRWDDRRARELYDLAGAYRQLYQEVNSEAITDDKPVLPEA